MLVTAGKKVLSAMQVVMLLAPGVLTTPRKRQCCSGKRNFFDFVPFPGAFQAKGGMSNVSDRSLCSVDGSDQPAGSACHGRKSRI